MGPKERNLGFEERESSNTDLGQDSKWKDSREYAMLATPVVFLIGEDSGRGRNAKSPLARKGRGGQKEE
jgi:hypothetical protein